jgi:hypothetical protein
MPSPPSAASKVCCQPPRTASGLMRPIKWSFCILVSCQERRTTPRPSPRYPVAASAWLPTTARPALATAPSRWSGAGRGGRRTAAATGSRPAKATGRPRPRAVRPTSLAGRSWRRVPRQIHPVTLPLDSPTSRSQSFLTAGLEGEQLGVLGPALNLTSCSLTVIFPRVASSRVHERVDLCNGYGGQSVVDSSLCVRVRRRELRGRDQVAE